MTETTTHATAAPWDNARMHARVLEAALLECGYREGSCSSDWSKKALKWQSLHDLAKQIVTGLDEI